MINNDNLARVLDELVEYIKAENYAGYGKYDAFNSPLLDHVSFQNRLVSLIITQAMMRSPINLRPLFGVEKSRNPKGIALFIRGYLTLYSLGKDDRYKNEAEKLLNWLMENHSNQAGEYSGICYGYNFIWQSPFFRAAKYSPNQTVSTFCGEAFILAYRVLKDKQYLDYAVSIAEYLLKDLPVLIENDSEKCIGYVSGDLSEKVININSMAAAFLSKLYKETGDDGYKSDAVKLITFVLRNITPEYAWYYTTDIRHSYIDNYHTGGIIEQVFETMIEIENQTWKDIILISAEHYYRNLFTSAGAPRNRISRTYPFDIHGSAQGIITFAKLAALEPGYAAYADTVLNWTLENLYSGRGYFYYQKCRFYTKKFTLMRWCNAWMLYALAEYLKSRAVIHE